MQPQQFIYPPHSIPLVEAYGSRFEAVFIVLHPFIRMPEELGWSATRRYPDDAQVLADGTKCTWAEVATQTGLGSSARVNQALLTSIGALNDPFADPAARNALQKYLENNPVWMPVEGRFEPLLQRDLLHAFKVAGAQELIFIPEFPETNPVAHFAIDDLRRGAIPFPDCGTLLAADASFLFTVDWDSFFTLFYGQRDFIRTVAGALNLEGFFATPNTEHAWFNYSFGCATVTLSPEHWQTI